MGGSGNKEAHHEQGRLECQASRNDPARRGARQGHDAMKDALVSGLVALAAAASLALVLLAVAS